MPAKIRLPSGTVLEINSFEWSSEDDPGLAEDLNVMKQMGDEDEVNRAISPDPDLEEAQRVQRHLGGEIFDHKDYNAPMPGVTLD
jgi:hypothetical protein